MRAKRLSIVLGLAGVVALCVLFAWPSLLDAWNVHRLRTEEGLFEEALLDPTSFPAPAVESFLRTTDGKEALLDLFIPVADRWFSHTKRFKKGYRRAIFFAYEKRCVYCVLSDSGSESGGGEAVEHDAVRLVTLASRLGSLTDGVFERSDPKRTITVLPGAEGARKFGLYYEFDTGSFISPSFLRENQADRPRPRSVTDEDMAKMNEGFVFVVERPKE